MFLLTVAGCGGGTPEVKDRGIFVYADGYLMPMRELGTLANSYGPRLFPTLPEYNIQVVPYVGPIYVNDPELPVKSLKGIEWHGYRLGGNGSVGSPSTATARDWKAVPLVTEATDTPGLSRIVVGLADAKGRWKPESAHEYFGLTLEGDNQGGRIWAVKIK